MMSKSIVQSERQRTRAIELMKQMYIAHQSDPNCPFARAGKSEDCPKLLSLKKDIEAEEALLEAGSNFPRSFGLK